MREPGIYQDIDISLYHADEGISSSGISLILDCPKRYWQEYLSGKPTDRKGKQYDIGQAMHTAILEPAKLQDRFYFASESFDLRTKAGKEAFTRVEAEAGHRTILRGADCEMILDMEAAVKNHPLWEKVELAKGNIEHSIYWDGGIYKTRLRARPDFYNENIIIDLKTTESIASFSKSVYSYGYHRQAAMQLDGLESIDGKKRHFAFFVIEKKAPYLTACFTLDDEALELGRKEYLEGAATYSECQRYNVWPGYEQKIQLLSLPKWAFKKDEEEII